MSARYLIGIDLGTTNSAVAYVDTHSESGPIEVFSVPQLVAHGEVRTLNGLPSFIYFPTEDELSSGAVSATWDEDPPMVTGVMAREQGALAPARQVSSAKSWLSFAGADRRGKILPAQAEPPLPTISPVEASARYLMHLRDAWNAAHEKDAQFENQEIVLTVPASFDEEARELTIEAARQAKLENVTLLEEPLAAFYAWMAARESSQGNENFKQLRDDDLILICDVGGGTSDFSLVRARQADRGFEFERTAVGEHILLGGDNLDAALVQVVEGKLRTKLSLHQRYALRQSCRTAKERLLSDDPPNQVAVTVLGSGTSVVGQAFSVELTHEEITRILLDGFLPLTKQDDMPARGRQTALRELGLPYASDPAITKHLAAFLSQAALTMETQGQIVRPDAVLFNGGFFTPALARKRIVEAIANWSGNVQQAWRPQVLENAGFDTAVARGAAHYGRVRRGVGRRVQAGSARTYYIGLSSADGLQAVCVLSAGTQEGTTLPLPNREFSVIANRPVSFTLYSSRTRHDAHGQVARLADADVHRHAPLVTLLRYGKKLRDVELSVQLQTIFTELGTLELWCELPSTGHRWKLQFELRGEGTQPDVEVAALRRAPKVQSLQGPDDASIRYAIERIRQVFVDPESDVGAADSLVNELEASLGKKRNHWPLSVARRLTEELLEVALGRRKSARHEVRWLSLTGFCLRPGFGAAGDESFVQRALRIGSQLEFAKDVQCQAEQLVFLRRIAGGINASEQNVIYKRFSPWLAEQSSGKRKSRLNTQVEHELWRMLANLEQLSANTRTSLGGMLVKRVINDPDDRLYSWALGRFGARIPLYGPLHGVLDGDKAEEWLEELLHLPSITSALSHAIASIARRTGDRVRDIADDTRQRVLSRLSESQFAPEILRPVAEIVLPVREDAISSFGESLPPGIELVTSSQCLLSVAGLQGYFNAPFRQTR